MLLFKGTDLVYGAEPGVVKFAMLEYIARVPYQAWERIGYLALARYRGAPRWPAGSSSVS